MAIHPSLLTAEAVEGEALAELIRMRGKRVIALQDNVLMGGRAICAYLKVSSLPTLLRWMDDYGLPLVKTADGKWMTTTTAIDQWIWLCSELEAEQRLDPNQRKVLKNIADVARPKPASAGTYTSSHIERAKRAGRGPDEVIVAATLRKMSKQYPLRGRNEDDHGGS